MANFEDFIEQVRDANPIEDVITESGIVLKGGHTKKGVVKGQMSLTVRCDWGRAYWYSENWEGDVYAWVMREKGCDFGDALEYLARRAHIEMPRFAREQDPVKVARARTTADVFSVAARVFHWFLVGHEDEERGLKIEPDAEALAYVRGKRGWTDETLRREMIGFSGRKTALHLNELKKEMQLVGVDLLSPAAVAVFGYQGDVMAWAAAQGIEKEAKEEGWEGKTYIHGLVDIPGVIYSHQWRNELGYLSRRNLPGFDTFTDKETGEVREKKSHNPNKVLIGHKKPYVNRVKNGNLIICVEGQGDSASYGQVGFRALAFCGLLKGDFASLSPEAAERLRQMAAWINKHKAVYLAMDDDEAGQKAMRQAGNLLGLKFQVLRMTRMMPREASVEVSNAE